MGTDAQQEAAGWRERGVSRHQPPTPVCGRKARLSSRPGSRSSSTAGLLSPSPASQQPARRSAPGMKAMADVHDPQHITASQTGDRVSSSSSYPSAPPPSSLPTPPLAVPQRNRRSMPSQRRRECVTRTVWRDAGMVVEQDAPELHPEEDNQPASQKLKIRGHSVLSTMTAPRAD